MKLLTVKNGSSTVTSKVDNDTYVWASKHSWFLKSKYATASIGGKHVTLHSLVNQTTLGLITDHKNRDVLDNRRRNLRSVDYTTNRINSKLYASNSTGYKGVFKGIGTFRVQIHYRGTKYNGGSHQTAREAALAHDILALSLDPSYSTNKSLGLLK